MKLSLALMIKNGSMTLERALLPLVGIVGEVCIHDTGSTPDHIKSQMEIVKRLGFRLEMTITDKSSHPERYFDDVPSSFKRSFPRLPFTGASVLGDWGWGHQVALDMCQSPYVIRVDADDVMLTPDALNPTLEYLDTRPDIDIVAFPYEIMNSSALARVEMLDRIWRNKKVRWTNVMHERLVPSSGENRLMAAAGLRMRDMRDNPSPGVRVAGRNFKVLLREFERMEALHDIFVSEEFLLTLGHEAVDVDADFAQEILSRVKGREFTAEAQYHLGRVEEKRGHLILALGHYEASYVMMKAPNAAAKRALVKRELQAILVDDQPFGCPSLEWKDDAEEALKLARKYSNINTEVGLIDDCRACLELLTKLKAV